MVGWMDRLVHCMLKALYMKLKGASAKRAKVEVDPQLPGSKHICRAMSQVDGAYGWEARSDFGPIGAD